MFFVTSYVVSQRCLRCRGSNRQSSAADEALHSRLTVVELPTTVTAPDERAQEPLSAERAIVEPVAHQDADDGRATGTSSSVSNPIVANKANKHEVVGNGQDQVLHGIPHAHGSLDDQVLLNDSVIVEGSATSLLRVGEKVRKGKPLVVRIKSSAGLCQRAITWRRTCTELNGKTRRTRWPKVWSVNTRGEVNWSLG